MWRGEADVKCSSLSITDTTVLVRATVTSCHPQNQACGHPLTEGGGSETLVLGDVRVHQSGRLPEGVFHPCSYREVVSYAVGRLPSDTVVLGGGQQSATLL